MLLHGLAVSADYWWRNGPAIATRGYRVFAPDLPGFGRTEGPPGGLSIEEQARALGRWADRMHLDRAIYVGHSLSCQSVLQYAVWQPERVSGMVLAAPSGDPVRFRRTRQAAGLLADAFLESWTLRIRVAQAYLRAGPGRSWQTWAAAARHDALAAAAAAASPGVVVVGTRDPVVRRGFAESLAERLPQGELRWIEGGTHAIIHDAAAEFNDEVIRFARRLHDGSGPNEPTGGAAAVG